MIISITGCLEDSHGNRRIAGAGKDEAAKVLVQHGFVSVAFADIMKRWCKELYGFTDEQLWGPSEDRTKPDERYPKKHANHCCQGAAVGSAAWHKPRVCGVCGAVGGEPPEGPKGDCVTCLTPRYALQKLGDWGRDCYPDIWANKALEIIKELLNPWIPPSAGLTGKWLRYSPQEGIENPEVIWHKKPYPGAVIPDCRFQNEFRRVKEEGGTIIRVKRLCAELPNKGLFDDSHVSERDILAWGDDKFDHVIENNGTVEELHYDVLRALGLPMIKFPQVVSY